MTAILGNEIASSALAEDNLDVDRRSAIGFADSFHGQERTGPRHSRRSPSARARHQRSSCLPRADPLAGELRHAT